MKLRFTLFGLFLFLAVIANAQNQAQENPNQLIRTAIFYTFEGANSLEEVERLRPEITRHEGVKEMKTIFKAEKKLAQVIVVFEEYPIKGEQGKNNDGVDKLFIKDVLINHNYTPTNYTFETLPTE